MFMYSFYVTPSLLFMSMNYRMEYLSFTGKILKQFAYWIVLCILEQKFEPMWNSHFESNVIEFYLLDYFETDSYFLKL